MIYLISDRIDVSSMNDVQKLPVEDSIALISSWPVVQFDTETTGLDPHVCQLASMQFGYHDYQTGDSTQIVVDCSSIDPLLYKRTIEASHLVGHNLKFDLEFLYNFHIAPLHVYDTMICEQLLYLGYKSGKVTYNLHDVLYRYTGIELDKSFQKDIATKGLTPEGIRYAANDVVHLQDIRRSQMLIARDRGCLNALTVENRFVPAIAYLEWCGIKLDEKKWKAKMDKDKANLEAYLDKLNSYVQTNTSLSDAFTVTCTELSLFEDPDVTMTPRCCVDWNSPKQVVPVLQKLGFDTKTKDKKTKKEKDSALEKLIATQKGIADDFLDIYFKYKEASKCVSSYGQGHLNQINPNTGRLHTVFRQFGTVTGRMSSGESKSFNRDLAKLKGLPDSDVSYCNLQNLPKDAETRGCFVAEDNNVFVSVDYAAEESRVQADVWNEKTLLDSFANGIDTHNLYAKLCFPDELKDVDVRDVKKLRPDLRQKAKSAEFAVGYGSDGTSIATSIGLPVDKARAMVTGILKGMPGMAKFKKQAGKFLKEHGYIIINKQTGHRIYWPEWAYWKSTEDRFDRKFWDDYRMYHKGTDDEVAQMVRKHISMGHDWFEKNVLNYPIQGGSAIVMKQAAADLFEWVVKNNLFGKVLFCVFVHDELDCECPKELAESFSKVVQNIMEKAAAKYYKRLPIPADCEVSSHWVH